MIDNPPDYIQSRALAEWHAKARYMKDNGFDLEEYSMTYVMYCMAVSHYEESVEDINVNGLTVDGRAQGSVVKNPAFTVLKESSERIAQASRAFGFTPSDKKRLQIAKDESDLPSWAKDL